MRWIQGTVVAATVVILPACDLVFGLDRPEDAGTPIVDAEPLPDGATCFVGWSPERVDPCDLGVLPTPLVLDMPGAYTIDTGAMLPVLLDPGMSQVPATIVARTQPGGPQLAVIYATNFVLKSGSTLRASGMRSLVILATEPLVVDGLLDVGSTGTESGPGAQMCQTQMGEDSTNTTTIGAGGGGGGGFGTAGGSGGSGQAAGTRPLGGLAVAASRPPRRCEAVARVAVVARATAGTRSRDQVGVRSSCRRASRSRWAEGSSPAEPVDSAVPRPTAVVVEAALAG